MTTRGAASIVVCVLVVTACDPGVRLGVPCELNSDCAEPLGCVLGRCREMCATARDCNSPEECLRTAAGLAACSIAEQDRCESAASCAEGLACVSGQCRQSCAIIDCAGGMRCGAADVCEREDLIDAAVVDASVDAAMLDDASIDAAMLADASNDAGTIDAGTCAAPCDLVSDCGCPATQHCGAPGGTVSCSPSRGTLEIRDACTAETECGAGLGCYGGRCVEYCRVSSDCSGAGVFCSMTSVSGATGIPSGYSLCSEPCDLFGDDSDCAMGTCTLAFIGGVVGETSYCRPVGALAVGAPCERDGQCPAHTTCEPRVVGGADRFCRLYCVPGTTCATGTCERAATVRGVPIGTCPPP